MTHSRGLRRGNREVAESVITIHGSYLHREGIITIAIGNGKGQIATLNDIDSIITTRNTITAPGCRRRDICIVAGISIKRSKQLNSRLLSHLKGVTGYIGLGGSISPVGTELRQVNGAFIDWLHYGSITLNEATAGDIDHNIRGTLTAQGQRCVIVGHGGRGERQGHWHHVGSFGRAEGSGIYTEHAGRIVQGQRNVTRQCLARHVEGEFLIAVHDDAAKVNIVAGNRNGGIDGGALHVPETGSSVLIDDHLSHRLAQKAGIAGDGAISLHIKFSGGSGTVGKFLLVALRPQVSTLTI